MLTTYKGGDHDLTFWTLIYYLSEERTNSLQCMGVNLTVAKSDRSLISKRIRSVIFLCPTKITVLHPSRTNLLNKLAIHPNGLRWNSNRTADPTNTKQNLTNISEFAVSIEWKGNRNRRGEIFSES